MAERLTECIDSHLLDNGEMVKEYSLNSKIKLNHFSCMDIPNAVYDKLGELEDILEKYGIDVEELEQELKIAHEIERLKDKNIDLNNAIIVFNKNFIKDYIREIEELKVVSDTWQKACELASNKLVDYEWKNKESTHSSQYWLDYFYQQAKKEGDDE